MTYRGLGFDPTPGSLDAVTQTIAQLAAAAEALAAVEPALHDAKRSSRTWQGAAAEAFRERLAATPTDVEPDTVLAAIPVLERWAQTLSAHKRFTEELDETARRLRAQLDDAMDTVQDKQNARDLASTSSAAAAASIELTGATNRVAGLEAELAEVLDRARTLERDHQRAADAVADELSGLRSGDAAARPGDRPAIRALSRLLGRASRTSTALGGLLTPGGGPVSAPAGAAGALAGALSAGPSSGVRATGELIVFGETTLPVSES